MPMTPCGDPGCSALLEEGTGRYCNEHQRAPNAGARPSAHARGYTRTWQRARNLWLIDHPLCVNPHRLHHGQAVFAANAVDHALPHRMDVDLFWEQRLWAGLCYACHSLKSRTIDRFIPASEYPELRATLVLPISNTRTTTPGLAKGQSWVGEAG